MADDWPCPNESCKNHTRMVPSHCRSACNIIARARRCSVVRVAHGRPMSRRSCAPRGLRKAHSLPGLRLRQDASAAGGGGRRALGGGRVGRGRLSRNRGTTHQRDMGDRRQIDSGSTPNRPQIDLRSTPDRQRLWSLGSCVACWYRRTMRQRCRQVATCSPSLRRRPMT